MDASPSPAVVRCAGDLSLRTCEATHAALLNALASHNEVVVDCTGGEEIDASFLQLLLATRNTAQGHGCRFRLSAPAEAALLDALVRGGFLDPEDPAASEAGSFWAGGGGNPR